MNLIKRLLVYVGLLPITRVAILKEAKKRFIKAAKERWVVGICSTISYTIQDYIPQMKKTFYTNGKLVNIYIPEFKPPKGKTFGNY